MTGVIPTTASEKPIRTRRCESPGCDQPAEWHGTCAEHYHEATWAAKKVHVGAPEGNVPNPYIAIEELKAQVATLQKALADRGGDK